MDMTKYGFSYFTQRAEVLNEMARPSPLSQLGEHGNIAKNIFDAIGAIMRKGGEVNGEMIPGMGGNREKNRQLRYFIYMMTGMDSDDTEDSISDEESKYEIVKAATDILGLSENEWRSPKGPYADADKLYRAAILEGVKGQYKEYVSSPEFKSKALNPDNILTYIASNRVTNATSHAIAAKREERHGMSAQDIDAAETGIKDILTKIHKAIFYKKRKKQPELAKQEVENSKNNEFIDNVYLVLDALEILIDNGDKIKQIVDSQLSKFGGNADEETFNSIIEDIHEAYPNLSTDYILTLYNANTDLLKTLQKAYSQLTDVGIDMVKFNNKLNIFKSKNGPTVQKLIDLLLFEIQELRNTMGMVNKYDVDQSTEEFPGYDQAVIDHFLTTPELKQQFSKFYNWLKTEMEAKEQKLQDKILAIKWGEHEVPGERDIVRKASKEFFDKRPEVKAQSFNTSNEIQKSLGPAQRNESYIMDYMTEQVSKDRFVSKGEFKDRGFKKASYHEWLLKNQ
jgi:hypothetical protein